MRPARRVGHVRQARGFTLIELMIGIAVFGTLLTLAIPYYTQFTQNTKVKTAAETTLQGINLARQEAIRMNAAVRFQLVSTLTNACALSTSGANWVVSLQDPTSLCATAPSTTVAPQIVQVRSGADGGQGVSVAATGGSSITYTGLGRVSGSAITQIDFSYPTGGACQHASASGVVRCLRILVTSGGAAKLCDPKVTATTDPRYCS